MVRRWNSFLMRMKEVFSPFFEAYRSGFSPAGQSSTHDVSISTSFLLGQHSSIHHEGNAGGKFRVVGTEIENRRGDFFAGANAPDRMKRREIIAHLAFFSGEAIDHVSCDTGGSLRVDTDVLFGGLPRETRGAPFDA